MLLILGLCRHASKLESGVQRKIKKNNFCRDIVAPKRLSDGPEGRKTGDFPSLVLLYAKIAKSSLEKESRAGRNTRKITKNTYIIGDY